MIIDSTENTTKVIPEFGKLGIEGVIRYINPHGQTSKCIALGEAQALGKAGVPVALVSEGWGDFAHGDISASAGTRDAQHALSSLLVMGGGNTSGVGIYFAVDTDASPALINGLVLPYLKAIRAVFAGSKLKPRIGIYGSGAVCEMAQSTKTADLFWLAQSTGWLRSKEYAAGRKWTLKQGPTTHLGGIEIDSNEASGEWGSFVPFASGSTLVTPPATAPASNVIPLTTPPAPAKPFAERRLDAATGAISAIMLNGVHNFASALPPWLQVIIPTSAVGAIAPVLAKAALTAADKENEDAS